MDGVINTFKNVAYVLIIFSLLDKALWTKKDETMVKFFAGLIVVLTIISPIYEAIDENAGDNLMEKISTMLNVSYSDDELTEIIEQNSKAGEKYIEEAGSGESAE